MRPETLTQLTSSVTRIFFLFSQQLRTENMRKLNLLSSLCDIWSGGGGV